MLALGALIWFIIILIIAINLLGWWCVPFVTIGVFLAISQFKAEKKRLHELWVEENTFHMPAEEYLIRRYNELVKLEGEEEAQKFWIEVDKKHKGSSYYLHAIDYHLVECRCKHWENLKKQRDELSDQI